MPANLTPSYLAAEARFKAARELPERIEALEEMLRVIPKHKGTDHLRADLKKRLSQLREEQRSAPKKGGRRADPGYVPKQGAGQVLLLGPSNTGKSSLMAALTNAEPEVGEYPYTTLRPQPGMMRFEDVPIQLVDTLATDPAVYEAWMNSLVRNADLGLLVVDPAIPGVLGAADVLLELLARSRVTLVPAWWAVGEGDDEVEAEARDETGAELDDDALLARLDPGEVELPLLMVAAKLDAGDNREQVEVLAELLDGAWPLLPVSAHDGEGLDALRRACYRGLRVIRVYAKPPGKPPSMKEPIVLPRGATVAEMARTVHKDLLANLRFARIWSERHFDGQKIPRDHVLQDGDVVEINA